MTQNICSVVGCPRSGQLRRGMCEAHYHRWRIHGDPGDAEIKPAKLYEDGSMCNFDGCENDVQARGLCNTHYSRWRIHGDPTVVLPSGRSSWDRPEDHPRWKGDAVVYESVHHRLRSQRGKASDHACAHCGEQARHWSYDKTDPNPKFGRQGCPYSTDPDRYVPLCISCHWKFDGAGKRLHAKKVAT